MTNKLKEKVKQTIQNTLTAVVGVATLACLGFVAYDSGVNLISAIDTSITGVSTEGDSSNSISSGGNTNVTIAEDGAIVCDSLVQGIRDCNLADGNYTFRVTGNISGTSEQKDYAVELINYYDDVTYSLESGQTSRTVSLGDSTTTYKMLAVKYHKDLTIDEGVTVTANMVNNLTYKKGMYLCVLGDVKNNGTISMTARGTYNLAGENVYLWKNMDNTYEYVPAKGGAGGAKKSTSGSNVSLNGNNGIAGTGRATGGGGTGGGRNWAKSITISAGGTGTSYSGGSGSGAANSDGSSGSAATSGAGSSVGGAGGQGVVKSGNSSGYGQISIGGTGNPSGGYQTYKESVVNYVGRRGTGGLLIMYADNLYNGGTISANGVSSSTCGISNSNGRVDPGGSSGGGSINIFANKVTNTKSITAAGGAATALSTKGGAGGNGTVTIMELGPDLICEEKSLILKINENYNIDTSDIQIFNNTTSQTEAIKKENLTFETLDSKVATVDENGNIKAVAEGKTKIKITDTKNGISTYVFVEVINNVKVDIQEGKNFTTALKQNGTVWSYGLNNYGQLGSGDNDNRSEPNQVYGLNDITEVSSGYSHSLALSNTGEVYAWGLGTSGQLGTGAEENSNIPVKISGLSNIKTIDAYKNISLALDKDGNLYVWGQGYSSLPMKVIFKEKVSDMSGNLILTKNGYVYDIKNLNTAISGLANIAKVSAGEAHYLALNTSGVVYAWGTNTYGECGTSTTGTRPVTEIAFDACDVSAGNCISMIQKENGDIYVIGNNANGQIGLGTTAKATAATKITLSEDIKITTISAGEGTHSGLVDENGFVWHSGTNTYGEINVSGVTTQKTFVKTGDTVLKLNQPDVVYLDLNENITLLGTIEYGFNLKIDTVDSDQSNFNISLSNNDAVAVNGSLLTTVQYGTTDVTVTHTPTGKSKTISITIIMQMDSLVQGFRDADLPDGNYEVLIQGQTYNVELINYYDDVRYSLEEGQTSRTVSLGDSTTEYKTLVVKYHKDLTVDKGVTLTATMVDKLTYKKGMYLCVLGDIHNKGTISMTARGTYNVAGEDVYLWKNINDTYEYVPAIGATGGVGKGTSSHNATLNGNAGNAGTGRQTGGGGTGGGRNWTSSIYIAAGGTGTSYSGGSGSGAANSDGSGGKRAVSGAGSSNGGAGGQGVVNSSNGSGYGQISLGGTGNLSGGYQCYKTTPVNYVQKNGTGGLLIMYADYLYNDGTISSNGVGSSTASPSKSYARVDPGGSSGGGSINIFAKQVINNENTTAAGGAATRLYSTGGAGGSGTVTINELGSILNYPQKKITLKMTENYQIDSSKLSYTKLNDIQTEDLELGNITYEIVGDDGIITVGSDGIVIPQSIGLSKVKITDTTNGYSTYVIVQVVSDVTDTQIEEGTDFTVALKQNGTVWTYGLNTNGQLGINSTDNSNEPVQVVDKNGIELTNIVNIGAGTASSIALNSNGEVYTWGAYTYLDVSGNEVTENRLVATKEASLSNIIQVESYGSNFYALDKDGNVYVWGKGYTGATKIETAVPIVRVSGSLLLGEDGKVYKVSSPTTAISGVSNICDMALGDDHYLFVTTDGYVYSLGKGDSGQLGRGSTTDATYPVLVRTENGYLENVIEVSANSKTSMALTLDGKAYAWGDNTNSKLGINGTKVTYATQITKLQDKYGEEVTLGKLENIETGKNHATISDEKGFVYSVGLNNLGQLGTSDNTATTIFTKIGNLDISTNPKEINIPIHTTQEISVMLSNGFNLKTDVAEQSNISVRNTDDVSVTLTDKGTINQVANYSITGHKIGRVCLVANSGDEYNKNIWINVVEDIENTTPVTSAKVVSGDGFTIALRSDGTVWSFGTNENGKLGLGDSGNRNEPTQITMPESIIDISSGKSHTLLLGKSGKVYTFGLNSNGQLGTGNTTTVKTPKQLDLTNIAKVVASGNTSYAITNSGRVYAWGEGYTKKPELLILKEIVQTTITENGEEKTVEITENRNVIDIGKTYYLSDDGIVRKISDDTEIKLSLNDYDPSQSPVYLDVKVVQMSEGTDHLLLLGQSGMVYGYGKNVYGQLGDNTTVARERNVTTVVKVEDGSLLTNIGEVSAGDKYSTVVSLDGKVYTFGINKYQQLGISNELETGGKQEIGYASLKEDVYNVERVSSGYNHTVVYAEDGNVYSWGEGTNGELGNGETFNYYNAQLVGGNEIETDTMQILLEENQTFNVNGYINYFNLFTNKEADITYEVADKDFAVANSQTGEVMALKEGRTTVIARENGTNKIAVIPLRILASGTKSDKVGMLIEPQVETNGSHTVTLKVDGTVWCYGIGQYGELGTGKIENSDEPVQAVFPTGTVILQVAAGENHCLALDSQGIVWAWGRNQYYQLGDTKNAYLETPTKVEGLSNIKKIACGVNNSFAIDENGEVYSFGFNSNGECGIKSYTSKIGVNKVSNVTGVIDIKAGRNHTILLKSTGEVYVTGSNLYGELGQNNTDIVKVNQFTKIPNLDTVVAIDAGDSHNIALKLDGTVYVWGSNIYRELGIGVNTNVVELPTKVSGLNDIRYVSAGKNYTTVLNKNNEVYVVGLNTTGELGNDSKTNVDTFTKLDTIQDVIQVSAGNTYTALLKTDGTVWGTGDYSHGDEEITSKTKGVIPVQVGNDETGLEETEITVKVGESKNIAANCSYEFNLINLDENFAETLNYNILNGEIASVNNSGVVKGTRIGTTRVNAVSTTTGKAYSVLVKVIGKDNTTAPKVESGENYAVVLKADGSVWSFGYNGDGALATGNYITKTTPYKTNILSTYTDIKTGSNFTLALRSDGTVWSAGNNQNGQLSSGTTKGRNKLSQIEDLQNIVKIAAGDNYALAIDKYGIVYEWGNGVTKPIVSQKVTQRVIDVDVSGTQSAFVTAKGTIVGCGGILTGEIPDIQNAIKVGVTNDKLVILTVDGNVYEYQNGTLTQVQIDGIVIDIKAKNTSVMYQTADEKVYVSGENTNGELGTGDKNAVTIPTLVNAHSENVFGMGVGYNNTYIIENTGSVYSAGNNTYGSIGNGTRDEQLEHTLVGDRKFDVTPITKTMKEGDTETLEITGNAFNVFGDTTMSYTEYNITSDDENIVSVDNGKLKAEGPGTAHIIVEDKVTLQQVELTRIILEQDKDRIAKITVNGVAAILDESSTEEHLVYKVQVVTNDTKGVLQVTTNDGTDRIKVYDETDWSYSGTFNGEITLPDKITEKTIIVGIQNNDGDYPLEENYTLIVERITDDTGIKKITATSTNEEGIESIVTATATSLTRYEVVVEENTTISLVDVLLNSEYSYVSIDGEEYTLQEQSKEITIGSELSKEVKITVKSEAGNEAEYTLVIYTKKEIVELTSLTVNGKEATRTSEGTYVATVGSDVNIAEVVASVDSNLVSISIANGDYAQKSNNASINLTDNPTEVSIKTKTFEGEIKEYTLYIYQEEEESPDNPDNPATNLKLDMLLVNGTFIQKESDGKTYIAYLPSADTQATIRAIAKDSTTKVKIADNEAEVGESQRVVDISSNENIYIVTLSDDEGNSYDYTVIIRKAEADTSIDEITVTNGDKEYTVTTVDRNNYIVKIPASLTAVDVTAITGYVKSKVQVNETGNYLVHEDTQTISITSDTTTVKIKVQSEDGAYEEEYTLIIEKMSQNTKLKKVTVDGNEATLKDDGKYHYTLTEATERVTVYALTDEEAPNNAWVNINNIGYELYETTRQIDITAKEIELPIKVKAEDGTIQNYILVIEGLPDDTTIASVTVNGKTANYIEGKNRYEVRSGDTSFKIDVVLNDLKASMVLGTNSKAIGTDTITVAKDGEETLVTVKVTSQNGLVTDEYTIAILEQSKNANLDILTVNGVELTPKDDGTYYTSIKNDVSQIDITATAEDTYAITSISENSGYAISGAQNGVTYIAKVSEIVINGTTIYEYTITVQAENGDSKTYSLTVEQLEANYNIVDVLVGEEETILQAAELKEDGNYYYKIGKVTEGYVSVNLESSKSSVKVNGETDTVVRVSLENEVTTIPIEVIAEDGTSKEFSLIIEKESSDTTIKSVTGDGVLKTEMDQDIVYVYVDEDLNDIDLTITLNNKYGSLKLSDETEYTLSEITRNIDLSGYESSGSVLVYVDVQAEDGTEKQYTISIFKQPNLNLLSVDVSIDGTPYEVSYNNENATYETLIPGQTKPTVVITAENSNQIVQLLLHTGDEESPEGEVIATGTGTLTTTLDLTGEELTNKYIIKVTSHNGETYGSATYNLIINEKSIETGITYVKVDNLGTIVSGTTYSSTVAGKDEYPVEIKLKDTKAKVQLLDEEENVVLDWAYGTLTGNVNIPDGVTRNFTIVVQAESGNETRYTLSIERVSSKTDIDTITVTDYDTNGTTIITKPVTYYDAETNTYRIAVSEKLNSTTVTIQTVSNLTTISTDPNTAAQGTLAINQALSGSGIEYVTIELTAPDGTTDTKYLEIVQLSSNIGIASIVVDGEIEATQISSGDYEAYITDKEPMANIRVTLEEPNSLVSINGLNEQYYETELDVQKGNHRDLPIIIKVTSEGGSVYSYVLTLHIISTNAGVQNVAVDGKDATISSDVPEGFDGKYIAYFDADGLEANVDITSAVEYATISHEGADGTTSNGVGTLNFKLDTSDLNKNSFVTTFKVMAEDGETEKVYQLECIRNSRDASIKNVFVQDMTNALLPNSGNPTYADGTYYKIVGETEAKVRIEANSEFAQIEFNGQTGTGVLEQTITLDTEKKVTEIPVTITSQQGTKYETTIYIEKISHNYGLTSVKVNTIEAEKQGETAYIGYIEDVTQAATIELLADDENAIIIRTMENGDTWLDENGNEVKGKKSLTFDVDTPDNLMTIYFKVIAEDNVEQAYTLQIKRKASDLSISNIEVTDYDTDGTTIITKQVSVYDEASKTYRIVVNRYLPTSTVTVMATSVYSTVTLDATYTATQTVTMDKNLNGLGATKVTIDVKGYDGTTDTRYLEIVQLSDEIGIEKVEVDGIEVLANSGGDYEASVTDKVDLANIKVTLKDISSKVSINGLNEKLYQTELDVSKGTNRKLVIPIKVTAEDGTTYTYNLTLNIISTNSDIQKVSVGGEEAKLLDVIPEGFDGKYVAYFDAYSTKTGVEVISNSQYATISQEELGVSGVGKLNFNLDTNDLTQKSFIATFKVTAEDGITIKEYQLECIRKSDDATIKEVYIQEELIAPNSGNPDYKDGTYYYETIMARVNIKVIANSEFAKVEFNGNSGTQELEQRILLSTENKVTEIPVKITSQQGTTYETTIYVKRLSNNYKLTSVKVDTIDSEKTEEDNTYLSYIYTTQSTAEVEIEAESEYATIVRTVANGDPWLDSTGVGRKGTQKLTMEVQTPDKENIFYFKIVAENGEESPVYKLLVNKMSDDNSIKEVYVNDELITPNENGEYIANVLDTDETPKVKVVTNHNLAYARIGLADEYLHIAEENVTLSSYKQSEVQLTVRSQSGLTNVTTLYINKIATSVKLDSVTLDEKQADYYNEATHTYTFLVDNSKEEFKLSILAESEYTSLKLSAPEYGDFEEAEDPNGSLNTNVKLLTTEEGRSYTLKTKSESGAMQEYTIDIVHTSDNTNLLFLKVNGILREPDEEGGDTYTITIGKDDTTALFELQTEYSYATIKLGDNTTVRQYEKGVLDINDLLKKEILVPIVVTAADGKTNRTYHVVLEREPGTYITGKVTTENVNGEHIADVTLYKVTENTGEELGENSFIGEDGKVRTIFKQTTTNSNGSFKILMCNTTEEYNPEDDEILNGTYEVVITKPGYLSYTVTDIVLVEEEASVIDPYKLIAGDTIETGEIEIDDLVAINEHYGIIVDYTEGVNDENVKYDFNGDGTIDGDDRNILKKNYGKKAEIVKWVNIFEELEGYSNSIASLSMEASNEISLSSANAISEADSSLSESAQGFIIPLNCEYTITSGYGYRIGPITEASEKHTGIDISGTHHAEVLAVADGEVTFAGVQTGYGNCIEIKHVVNGKTIYSFYAHLSQINVQTGDKVAQGQVIALEGGDPDTDPNPGDSTGHHLHFEIRTASGYGNDVDPTDYIDF